MMEWFLEPLGFEFMQRALTIAVISAVACGLISCWLVLVGWSLMGDAVSHAVLPGVVLAYLVDIPFAVGALAFGLLAVALIGVIRETSNIKEDAAIGIVFTALFALGLVLISAIPSQIDLGHILFGNILGVSDGDLIQVAVLGPITAAILFVKRKDLTLYAFDPAHASVIGLSPRRLSALLLILLAVTAVVGLQAVGVVLVVATLIIPGATAFLLTESIWRMLVIAPVLASAASIAGIYVSYYADVSSGGMIVLAQAVLFTLAYLFAPKRGLISARAREPRPKGA